MERVLSAEGTTTGEEVQPKSLPRGEAAPEQAERGRSWGRGPGGIDSMLLQFF